ncbi:Ccz1 [Kluyveromyces lactis]|nr:Ccz1 [Kluyveromyces lactis]
MSVQFIVLFRDDDDNKNDSCKLLLYHDLTEHMLSTNEKEQKIGIIKGMWRFSNEFSHNNEYCHVELDSYSMLVLEVEPSYYLALGFENTYNSQWPKYKVRLSQCYQFFAMQHGKMQDIEDKTLSGLLNEHFIPFWDEINLIPDYFLMQDINTAIDDKMFPCCQFADALNCISEVKDWQNYLKNNVLLSEENYLNIKDVCVYHLPKNNKNTKEYGFITNFDPQFKSLPTLSNWLVGIDSMYGTVSSHGLAGTMSLTETEQQIELDAEEAHHEQPPNIKTVWDNVTLPITFTMDALKDIGQLTGVSNSLSLFTNLKPSWNLWSSSSENSAGSAKLDDKDEYSWLISPLNPSFLPKVYQMRKFYLQFDDWSQYNILFWKFKDVIVAVIVDPSFKKISEESFLMKLQEELWNGISLFYENTGFEKRQCSFDYTILFKEEGKYYSSIPRWKNGLDESDTALKLVIKGLDETLQFLTNNANRKSSVATVTEVWHDMSLTEHPIPSDPSKGEDGTEKSDKSESSIFSKLNESQLVELNKELMVILGTRSLTAWYKDANTKERMLKLNNGLMVYLLENNRKLVLIIKNWFIDSQQKTKSKRSTDMIESLGKDVSTWWNRIKDHEPL